MPPAVADEFAGFSYAFRFASLEQPQHPDAAAGDAVAVSPFVFEEFAGGLLDERGVVVCHSKGGAQTNQKGIITPCKMRSDRPQCKIGENAFFAGRCFSERVKALLTMNGGIDIDSGLANSNPIFGEDPVPVVVVISRR